MLTRWNQASASLAADCAAVGSTSSRLATWSGLGLGLGLGLELGLGLGLGLDIEAIGHQRGQRQQCSPQREGAARDRLHEATQ